MHKLCNDARMFVGQTLLSMQLLNRAKNLCARYERECENCKVHERKIFQFSENNLHDGKCSLVAFFSGCRNYEMEYWFAMAWLVCELKFQHVCIMKNGFLLNVNNIDANLGQSSKDSRACFSCSFSSLNYAYYLSFSWLLSSFKIISQCPRFNSTNPKEPFSDSIKL